MKIEGSQAIADYLGVNQSYFITRVAPNMREAGLLWKKKTWVKTRNGGRRHVRKYHTFTHLIDRWLIRRGGNMTKPDKLIGDSDEVKEAFDGEVPFKIYLQWRDGEVTWCQDKISDDDLVYRRDV